jgi:hypothetical protein
MFVMGIDLLTRVSVQNCLHGSHKNSLDDGFVLFADKTPSMYLIK